MLLIRRKTILDQTILNQTTRKERAIEFAALVCKIKWDRSSERRYAGGRVRNHDFCLIG